MTHPLENRPSERLKVSTKGLVFTLFEDDDGAREGIALSVVVCTSPECPCTEVTLRGESFDHPRGGERVHSGVRFDLRFDVVTNALSGFESARTARERGLQDALRDQMKRKKNRALLAALFRERRATLVPVADPTYDFSQHHDGILAGYADVFPRAGVPVVWVDESKFFFDDQWCVDPGCDCPQGVIEVLASTDPGDTSSPLATIGSIRMPSGAIEQVGPRLTAAVCAAAFEPEVVATFARRRAELRAEAANRWGVPVKARPPAPAPRRVPQIASPTAEVFDEIARAARANRAKVGRNEPCPCGSGKKFKRCCG